MFQIFTRKHRGFTLIELLVVIAIIGILSGIVLTSISAARAKARNVIRKSDLHQYELAQEMYYTSNFRYTDVSQIMDGAGEICYAFSGDPDPDLDYCVAASFTMGGYSFDDSIFDPDWAEANLLLNILSAFPIDPLNGQSKCYLAGNKICGYAYAVNIHDYQKFALYAQLENGRRYLICSKGYKIETDMTGGPVEECLQ
jgi:prepilin-type N-terminal cleavage/methylation domain-containing protein